MLGSKTRGKGGKSERAGTVKGGKSSHLRKLGTMVRKKGTLVRKKDGYHV